VTAHGNSLRALIKMLDGVSEAEIVELNVPTGVPLVYDFTLEGPRLRPTGRRYLGDPEAIRAAAEAVRKQTERR
jgi:2,3-bisphosphoglycerate-dependent phosphoglycerate mutase